MQNIGAMIRQNFPQSQFIVVSLKEGLFNNANVIFRTKFVDGVSQVLRTENNSRMWGAAGQVVTLPEVLCREPCPGMPAPYCTSVAFSWQGAFQSFLLQCLVLSDHCSAWC